MKRYSYERRIREKRVEIIVKPLRKAQWKYRNLILLFVSVAAAYALVRTPYFNQLATSMEHFAVPSSFFAGLLYAFSLSVAPAVAIFYSLGKAANPLVIGLVGSLGCVIGDYAIFRFVKEKLACEIKMLIEEVHGKATCIFKTSIFYKLFPFSNLLLSRKFEVMMWKASRSRTWKILTWAIAVSILASPLPDELGIMILGAANQQTKKFLVLSYFANLAGILGVLYFSKG